MKIYHLLGATAILAAPATAQGVKAGIDAWGRADYSGALAVWRPLAAKGNPDAMFNLGQLYRLGRSVPIDLAEAEAWYTRAARAGHVTAQTQLGMLLFQNGEPRAAVLWLQRAADKGDARAELLYGTALYNGDGVAKRDILLAYSFVAKAAAQGLGPAKSTLADMDREIPPQLRRLALAGTTSRAVAVASTKPTAKAAPTLEPGAPSAKPPSVAAKPSAPGGTWRIQLGAFTRRDGAEALVGRLGGALGGKQPNYLAAGAVVRLQVGPFASKADATRGCAPLTARGQPCFVVPPTR